MAPDAVTQERVYLALKSDLLSDGHRAGARIDLQRVADRHRASTTPVREAIHRLIGERLVEPHDDGGFRIALPGPPQLLDLYMWNAQHLLAAVHMTRPADLGRALETHHHQLTGQGLQEPVAIIAALFGAIGRATGNSEFLLQIEAANDRLFHPRLAEARYFGDASRELRILTQSGGSSVQASARRRLIAYHRRRIQHVSQIAHILSQ